MDLYSFLPSSAIIKDDNEFADAGIEVGGYPADAGSRFMRGCLQFLRR
jgi:hypothetical protein